MPRLYSNRDRPFDMGALPTERLERDPSAAPAAAAMPADAWPPGATALAHAVPEYRRLCAAFLDGAPAPRRAPVPEDPGARCARCCAASR